MSEVEWLNDGAERRFILDVSIRESESPRRSMRGEYDTLTEAVAAAEKVFVSFNPGEWGFTSRDTAFVWDRREHREKAIVWQGWPVEVWRRQRKLLRSFVQGIKSNEPPGEVYE